MKIEAIKTKLYSKNKSLEDFLLNSIRHILKPKMVLAVTSKLFSLSQGLIIDKNEVSKEDLIKKEADLYICEGLYGYHLTIKNNLIMPTAGIDQSNSSGNYLLLPSNIHQLTRDMHHFLSNQLNFSDWGIIVTDSKSSPLRLGVTGFSISYYGIKGLNDLKNTKDLFGDNIRVTTVNNVDPLAAAAVHLMGESNEQTPLAIIENAKVTFSKEKNLSLYIEPNNDIYSPLYTIHK